MQMKYALSGRSSIIHHEAEGIRYALLHGDLAGGKQQMSEHRLVPRSGIHKTRQRGFGDNQDMHRRLRVDITKCQAKLILENDVCRYLPLDDSGE